MRCSSGLDQENSNVSKKKRLDNGYVLTLAPIKLPKELEIRHERGKKKRVMIELNNWKDGTAIF